MGLLDIKEIDNESIGNLNGRKVAVALQKEYYINSNGIEKFKMNPLSFFYPVTLQTYTEKINGKEANTSKRKIKDKMPENQPATQTQVNDPFDEELSF